jgi:hypothetical protein
MKRIAFFGLLQRRECLVPTWQGLFLFILLGAGFLSIALLNIQPFLTLTEPVKAEVLVVEGWVPDYVLEKAVVEFERGHYSKLFVTGGPIEEGGMLSEYKTFADLGAAILVKMGVSSSVIEAVPAPSVRRDRTYASALALKSRLHQQSPGVTGINLVSIGVHARRSHRLFQMAFGNDVRVGIIAIENRNYSNEPWWKYSDGVRTVIDELFAYIYALTIFPFIEP